MVLIHTIMNTGPFLYPQICFSWLWFCVVLKVDNNISEECTAPFSNTELHLFWNTSILMMKVVFSSETMAVIYQTTEEITRTYFHRRENCNFKPPFLFSCLIKLVWLSRLTQRLCIWFLAGGSWFRYSWGIGIIFIELRVLMIAFINSLCIHRVISLSGLFSDPLTISNNASDYIVSNEIIIRE
jgi:hypothetical protein